MYDMYPWDDPADSRSAEFRTIPAAATRAVQVALDRRDNGGDGVPVASASQPPASLTRQ